ncbi:alternative ribosome rescue aminoacyl-tRNA hydrolase ArfB [Longimicrobium sp.]|uniref:alternative ribosome rescue aminoacyl-tRNA hydrolase ArfB n=1 Tax=Longimicrobium sp. TaxID=2029185 RepID=UPI002CF89FBE|nr:alternative ribosome rescue aminoacyl-tRNA hydrolase ArfB [Longimicrobium sp.]HSU14220.1 alternative ribosome rescue aminoacyl-tRNA hydrolase ArfB [Longimicrobium sp.]
MSDDGVLAINESLWVPRTELAYRATRSGGPGGQHVNTSSTRVELVWDVDASPSLSDEQRARIREKLANRISGEGTLLLAASEHRSQHQNKEAVTERFVELVRQALVVPKKRRKTRPSAASREERLRAKKHRSEVKRSRRTLED